MNAVTETWSKPNPLLYLDALGITVWQPRDKALRVADAFKEVQDTVSSSGISQPEESVENTHSSTAPPAAVVATTEAVTPHAAPLQQTQDSALPDTSAQFPLQGLPPQGLPPFTATADAPPPTPPKTPVAEIIDTDALPDYLFVPPEALLADNFEPLLPDDDEAFSPAPEVDPKQIRAQDILGLDWQALQARVQACKDCELHKQRNNTVFGVGDVQARWLIVGEAPGHDEDLQGEPFVGRAGQLLNAMLQAVGVQREQVFIANTVKCRPPHNRNPEVLEMETCAPYLQRQIQLIQPQLILLIGRVAVSQILQTEEAIGRLRGKLHSYADTGIPVVVSYHPAYLLRRPAEKAKVWADLQLAYRQVRPLD